MTLVRLESMLPMRVRSLRYRFESYLIFVTDTTYGLNAMISKMTLSSVTMIMGIIIIEDYAADDNEITAPYRFH